MPTGQQGFTLVEVVIAAVILMVVAVSSFSAFTNSSRVVRNSETLSGVSSVERVAQSYLRNLDFGTLSKATESTVATAIKAQLKATDWARLGATGSLSVTRMLVEQKLVTVDLSISYGAGSVATSSLRIARRGVNP